MWAMGYHRQDFFKHKILWLSFVNSTCGFLMMIWCQSTNSMGLTAYSLLTLLDAMNILTSLLNRWVRKKPPDATFTFGYEHWEVMTVFSSSVLTQLCALLVLKESLERLIQQPEIHMGRFLPGALLIFLCHLLVTYGIDNNALSHVMTSCSSSYLQEHAADVSQSVCQILPGLSGFLLPRINSFLLLGWGGVVLLWMTHFLIEYHEYHVADTLASLCFSVILITSIFPMCSYCGRILLHTTPSHVIGQLDKCLREASTLDGVLEFRHEKFWTYTFGKLTGSIHVRIGRDANEQLVLAHLVDRLSNLVLDLTVQVFKDDWAWHTSTLHLLNESSLRFPSANENVNATSSKQLCQTNLLKNSPYITNCSSDQFPRQEILAYETNHQETNSLDLHSRTLTSV